MTQFYNLDAGESVFFARQLEFVKAKTYDIRYADLMFRKFIPQSTEPDPGAETVTYEQFSEVGVARIGSGRSGHAPRVDVAGEEFTRPVRPVEASYGWTVYEVKAAQMAKRNLNQRRAAACRRAIERKLDEIAAIGAPLYGIATGALNDAAIPIDASAGSWLAPAAPDTIISEVAEMYTDIFNDTLQTERADTLVLPPREWAHISTTPRTTTNDTTIIEFIRKSFPGLSTIEAWYRLTTAGAGSVRRGWMYPRRDEVMQNEITNDFEQLPVQPVGLQYVVNAFARTAGVAVYYPIACKFLDGI